MIINPDLSEKVAIVTGGDCGIGKAIALALAQCKISVIVAARTQIEVEAVLKVIKKSGGKSIMDKVYNHRRSSTPF